MVSTTTAEKTLGLTDGLLEQIIKAVVRHSNVRRIIIYGSRARGGFSPVSDIDVAVDCWDGKAILRSVIDEEVRTLLKLDIVNIREINDELRKEIEREGMVVYEKD